MSELEQARQDLEVVEFQIEQREITHRDVPGILFEHRDFFRAEVERLEAQARAARR